MSCPWSPTADPFAQSMRRSRRRRAGSLDGRTAPGSARRRGYGAAMSDTGSVPDLDRFYDDDAGSGLTCTVCGCLVSPLKDYRRAHWDWHEASNGA